MKEKNIIVALTTITTLNVANQSLFNNNKIINVITILLCLGVIGKIVRGRGK